MCHLNYTTELHNSVAIESAVRVQWNRRYQLVFQWAMFTNRKTRNVKGFAFFLPSNTTPCKPRMHILRYVSWLQKERTFFVSLATSFKREERTTSGPVLACRVRRDPASQFFPEPGGALLEICGTPRNIVRLDYPVTPVFLPLFFYCRVF